jgi:uncharacterized cupredoxin-like copper-binding protein
MGRLRTATRRPQRHAVHEHLPTRVRGARRRAGGGKQTRLIGPGKTARLTVTFHKKGRFSYVCTVSGHAQAGMKGVFTVR